MAPNSFSHRGPKNPGSKNPSGAVARASSLVVAVADAPPPSSDAREISRDDRGKPAGDGRVRSGMLRTTRDSAGVLLALSSSDRPVAEVKGGAPCSI
jgi:hypothetical protein